MNHTISKIILFLMLSLPSFTLWAQTEKKDFNFEVDATVLLKGELHYSFAVLSPAGIAKDFPQMVNFDSLGLLNKKDASLLISKAAYVVNKPVGFFDQQTTQNDELITYLLGEQKVRKINESTFGVTVPGEPPLTYKLSYFYDSDDISTVKNSRGVKSVTAAKQLDVLAQSASSIIYQEMTDFNLGSLGGVMVSAYIPLKENRTLVISIKMVSLRDYANDTELKSNTVNEYVSSRRLINSYKPAE